MWYKSIGMNEGVFGNIATQIKVVQIPNGIEGESQVTVTIIGAEHLSSVCEEHLEESGVVINLVTNYLTNLTDNGDIQPDGFTNLTRAMYAVHAVLINRGVNLLAMGREKADNYMEGLLEEGVVMQWVRDCCGLPLERTERVDEKSNVQVEYRMNSDARSKFAQRLREKRAIIAITASPDERSQGLNLDMLEDPYVLGVYRKALENGGLLLGSVSKTDFGLVVTINRLKLERSFNDEILAGKDEPAQGAIVRTFAAMSMGTIALGLHPGERGGLCKINVKELILQAIEELKGYGILHDTDYKLEVNQQLLQ